MPKKIPEKRLVYLERKEEGLCPRCGAKKKKSEVHIYCDKCRAFFRNYNSKISGELNKKRKQRYEERKEKDLCPRCGKRLGKTYKKTICAACLEKQYKYNYKKDRPKTKGKAPAAKKA